MEDCSVASSPNSEPYVIDDNILPSIDQIPTLELEPPTDVEDSGFTSDLEDTTQINFYDLIKAPSKTHGDPGPSASPRDIDIEKGRLSAEDDFNFDGHNLSLYGHKHDLLALPQLRHERTSTSLTNSVAEFFQGHEQAKAAMDYEHNLSLRYALGHFGPALFWALCMAACAVTDGYESSLVPTLLSGNQPFARRYGRLPKDVCWEDPLAHELDSDGNGVMDFEIPVAWQIGINLVPAFGVLIGLVSAAQLVNRLGYCQCAMLALVAACCALSIPLVSTMDFGQDGKGKDTSLAVFMLGEFCLGIPWGVLSSIVTSYVSDVTPLKLRVFATTMINIFWLIGGSFSVLAVQGFGQLVPRPQQHNYPDIEKSFPSALGESEHWAFRGPMLMQYIWVIPLILFLRCAPDSPMF